MVKYSINVPKKKKKHENDLVGQSLRLLLNLAHARLY